MTLQSEPSKAADRWWSARECWLYLGIGQTQFYELCAGPDFPDCIRIGRRTVRWLASEVQAYAEAHRAKREVADA